MDLDLFSAFDTGEALEGPVSAPAKKRSASTLGGTPASLVKKRTEEEPSGDGDESVGAAAAPAPAEAASFITHTEVRTMTWSGRSVLTFSALPGPLLQSRSGESKVAHRSLTSVYFCDGKSPCQRDAETPATIKT